MRRCAVLATLSAACAAATTALWILAVRRPDGRRLDASIADAVHSVFGPSLDDVIKGISSLAGALPFAVGVVALVALAWLRRGPPLALVAAFVVLGANVATQLLQPALAASRKVDFTGTALAVVSPWPSGHATAAMALALGAALVAGPRLRAVTAAAGGAFALVVGVAMLATLGHLASDVLAGFLVAAAFAAAGAAVLARWVPGRKGGPTRSPAVAPVLGVLAGAAVLATAVGQAGVTRRDELAGALGQVPALLVAGVAGVVVLGAAAVAVWRRSNS